MHIPFACKQGALNSLGLMVSHYTTTSLLMTSGKHPHSLFTILLKQLLCSLTLTILDMPLSNFITNHVEPFLQVIQQFPNGIVISTQTTGRIRIPIWIMQAHNCAKIEEDMHLHKGRGHTNDGGVVVRSPLKSTSQLSWAMPPNESR